MSVYVLSRFLVWKDIEVLFAVNAFPYMEIFMFSLSVEPMYRNKYLCLL